MERDLGLRPKPLNEYENSDDEAKTDIAKDADIFMYSFRHTYSEIRTRHRERISSIKMTDYDAFTALRK